MSDQNVRLSLRIHDEVGQLQRNNFPLHTDIVSAMGATYLDLISVHAVRILFSVSRKLSKRHRMVGVGW